VIRAHHLSKSYGAFRAVHDVSFTVERGEVVGFLGPNGAGKSTTMRILTGVSTHDTGHVEVAGCELPRESLAARRRIGYLPESTPLLRAMRVDRYLDFVASAKGLARRERHAAVARAAEASDLHGYLGRRIEELSKGYRQRVGLAQALIGDPDVLVLDEPTSGLDPNEVVRIRELVRALAQRATVLLSTHVLSEVEELCPRVLILSGGRLVADGAPLALANAQDRTLLVRFAGPLGAHAAALERISGVRHSVGVPSASGEARRLATDDPDAVAPRVVAFAREHGLELVELRHEAPTLEQVFARRTAARDERFDAPASAAANTSAPSASSEAPR
jgi:ABC-2 type transport system ATP-binding protein